MGPIFAACLAGAGLTLTAASTRAQSAPLAAPAQPTPDRVKTKDGSMYRGTILEIVAGDHVDLRLSSGEVKRFASADVVYAGAAVDGAPPAPAAQRGPQPLVTLDAASAKLHFEATSPDIDFHIRTGEAVVSGEMWTGRGGGAYAGTATDYEPICTAPCDATLPVGTHRLALSQNGHSPVEPDEPTVIRAPRRCAARM